MSNPLLIASVNVRSVLSDVCFCTILHFFRMSKLDVLCIQEACLSKDQVDCLNATFPGMRLLTNPNNNRDGHGGVAIMINPEMVSFHNATLPHNLGNFSLEDYLYNATGHLLVSKLDCSSRQQLNIACVYIPAQQAHHMAWLEDTANLIVSFENWIRCNLVAGDWNTTTSTKDHTSQRRPNFLERHRLMTFISILNDKTGLIDGYCKSFPEAIMYTHKSHNSEAYLDQIYVTPALFNRSTAWETQVLPKSLNLDHHMVTVGIKPIQAAKHGPGRFRFKVAS